MVAFAYLPLLLAAGSSGAEPAIDWAAQAEAQTVIAVTTDEDGEIRETKAWLVVVDAEGYIRTGNTRWGRNLERDPRLLLRVGEDEFSLRVVFVTDESEREKIEAAFREKYGFWDRIISPFRGGSPKMMQLVPVAGE
jgi:putative heme iron utilization protein